MFVKGQKSWNKGLKIGETHPQMGFQKENKVWDNENTKASQFKEGVCISPTTMFKKGQTAWNKGIPFRAGIPKPWKSVHGEDNPNYLGPELRKKNEKKHLDSEYRVWMFSVKKRDGWKCRIADENCDGRLEAHHILNWIEYPELRYQINNGITLCHAHHPRKRAEEKRLSPYFQDLVSVSKY